MSFFCVAFLIVSLLPSVLFILTCTPSIPKNPLREKWLKFQINKVQGPMGLLNKKHNRNAHSFIDTSNMVSILDYYNSLSRDSQRYLKKCESILINNNIKYITKRENEFKLTFGHFKCILSHQKRKFSEKYSIISIIFMSIMKFIVILFFTYKYGKLIEYYDISNKNNYKLIAFSQNIGKGETLRAMWFYQKSKYCKYRIWFHCVQLSIINVIKHSKLKYIDLGPSYDLYVLNTKTKFGFKTIRNWRIYYNGDFVNL